MLKSVRPILLLVPSAISLAMLGCGKATSVVEGPVPVPHADGLNGDQIPRQATAILAGGCFWCVESDFEKLPGVTDVVSGYSGGTSENPTYENYADSGHIEVVQVTYDPTQVSFAGLVEWLIKHSDPTDAEGSFYDRGKQYSPVVYYDNEQEQAAAERVIRAVDELQVYDKPLAIAVAKREQFWPAEDYHQDYHANSLIKYDYYRLKSGRDAFIQKHWGDRAKKLELPGATNEN